VRFVQVQRADVGMRDQAVAARNRHDLGRAQESGAEGRGGREVERARRADLDQPAGVHQRDAVGQHQGFLLVVRDVDGRHADALEQVAQLDAHLLAQLGVEVGQRLVQQHDRGAAHQGAGDGHALLLAARKLRGAARGQRAQAHHVQRLGHAPSRLVGRQLHDVQREGHVLSHRHVRPDGIGLEHHGDVARVRGHMGLGGRVEHALRADGDAARGRRLQAGHAAQGACLAAAAGPQQGEELAGLYRQRDAVDGRVWAPG
jgi:hypothetical protein